MNSLNSLVLSFNKKLNDEKKSETDENKSENIKNNNIKPSLISILVWTFLEYFIISLTLSLFKLLNKKYSLEQGLFVIEGENLDITLGSMPLDEDEKEPVKANVLRLLKEKYGAENIMNLVDRIILDKKYDSFTFLIYYSK